MLDKVNVVAEEIGMMHRAAKETKAITKPPGRKAAQDRSPAPPQFGVFAFVTLLVVALMLWWVVRKLRRSSFRIEISQMGYLIVDGQFQHRMIAERVLDRKLVPGEVVHHINGIKTDNRESNLCVLDSLAHDDFHIWLRQKVEKEGFYPPKNYQRAVLRDRYRGILIATYPNDLPPFEGRT